MASQTAAAFSSPESMRRSTSIQSFVPKYDETPPHPNTNRSSCFSVSSPPQHRTEVRGVLSPARQSKLFEHHVIHEVATAGDRRQQTASSDNRIELARAS